MMLKSILICAYLLLISIVSYSQENECLVFYKSGKGTIAHLCAGDEITFSTIDLKGFTTSKILAVYKNHIKLTDDIILAIDDIDKVKLRRKSSVLRLFKTGGANIVLAGILFNLGDASHRGFKWTTTNTYVLIGGLVIGTSIILYPNYRKCTIGNRYRIRTSHY